MCDLNCSVQGRVPSLRMSFRTPLNLNSEVSNPKILLFSYWFFMQIGWAGLNLKSEVPYAPNQGSKVSKNSYSSWKLVLLLSHSESTHPLPPLELEKRAVHILLECFLVSFDFMRMGRGVVGISGPISFPGVSLVPGPFQG